MGSELNLHYAFVVVYGKSRKWEEVTFFEPAIKPPVMEATSLSHQRRLASAANDVIKECI